MALLKSLVNPQNYLKVVCTPSPISMAAAKNNGMDSNPDFLQFAVNYVIFESQEDRILADNPENFIDKKYGTKLFSFLPEIPANFSGNEYQKLITLSYKALRTLPEFGQEIWEDYQPVQVESPLNNLNT